MGTDAILILVIVGSIFIIASFFGELPKKIGIIEFYGENDVNSRKFTTGQRIIAAVLGLCFYAAIPILSVALRQPTATITPPQIAVANTSAPIALPFIATNTLTNPASTSSSTPTLAPTVSNTPTIAATATFSDTAIVTYTPRPSQTPIATSILVATAPYTVTAGVAVTTLPTPTGKLLFSENFEDGSAHGFSFYAGNWTVIADGTGNKVLEVKTSDGSMNASFGPPNFLNGTIEFRFRVISADYQIQYHIVDLGLRNQTVINGDWTEYVVAYDPASLPSLYLNYQEKGGSWQPLEGNSGGGTIQDPNGGWVALRVEAQEKNIRVFVNGQLYTTAHDSRIEQGGGLYLGGLGNLTVQFADFKIWDISSK
ncbi:MAG: hypothetical protein ABI947_21440 [Chloroflexota bacterium]